MFKIIFLIIFLTISGNCYVLKQEISKQAVSPNNVLGQIFGIIMAPCRFLSGSVQSTSGGSRAPQTQATTTTTAKPVTVPFCKRCPTHAPATTSTTTQATTTTTTTPAPSTTTITTISTTPDICGKPLPFTIQGKGGLETSVDVAGCTCVDLRKNDLNGHVHGANTFGQCFIIYVGFGCSGQSAQLDATPDWQYFYNSGTQPNGIMALAPFWDKDVSVKTC